MKKVILIVLCLVLAMAAFAGCAKGDQGIRGEKGEKGDRGLSGDAGKGSYQSNSSFVQCGHDDSCVNLYVTCGSLPTLYAGLHAFSEPSVEGYMLYERRGTFDDEVLIQNTGIKRIYQVPFAGSTLNEIAEFREKVVELYEENEDRSFHLFCDDLRVQLEITLFLSQGIPEENFDVTLLSDGTGTYSGTYAFPYKNANGYSDFKAIKQTYDAKYIEGATTGNTSLINAETPIWNTVYGVDLAKAAFYAAQKQNFRYWMQFPEVVDGFIQDDRVRIEFAYSNIEKVSPTDLLNRLSPIKKAQFALAGKIDAAAYGELFGKNGKKDLVFTGTSPAGENDNFNNVLDRIIELYGEEYNIFFKAHPSWGPENVPATPDANWQKIVGRREVFEEKGVTLLPSITPMEILMWFYPHLEVGGYNSSLYMNIDRYRTRFFVIHDADGDGDYYEHLGAPLPDLVSFGFFESESGENPLVIPRDYNPEE